jgi:8-hydroxy-5-deazaflavin:NADPH oxidoreductase
MKIGIIGIGNIGGTIARKLKAAGHEIRVANSRGPESVRRFADEIGATAADVNGAVDGVDVIFLSIPLPAIAELPNGLLKADPEDVPVVDTSNYYPGMRDPRIPEIDEGMPELNYFLSNRRLPGLNLDEYERLDCTSRKD